MSDSTTYPRDRQETLVIYAMYDEDADPNEQSPYTVLHKDSYDSEVFISDQAPYLSVLDTQDMLQEIDVYISSIQPYTYKVTARSTKKWIQDMSKQWYTYFMHELEPEHLAWKAYPLAKKAEVM